LAPTSWYYWGRLTLSLSGLSEHNKNNSSISKNADEEKSNLITSKDKVIDSQKHTQPIQD
jgi:hypothetical protein